MKLGIVLNTNMPETAWNALRLGNTALKAGHEVSMFLMGSGVEIENIESQIYDVGGTLTLFSQQRRQPSRVRYLPQIKAS